MLNITSYRSEINQLYHPTAKFNPESEKKVYSNQNINRLKFTPILLKEWFYLVKKNGHLIVDYKENTFCNMDKLEENMEWLWRGKYKILYHGSQKGYKVKELGGNKNLGDNLIRFVCRKTVSLKLQNDDITKWTFGIITNGKRLDFIEKIIDSIRTQKIPNYEIIICGTYPLKIEKDIKYIKFNQKDDKGWITKKKNLIVSLAKYENVCMLHDRIALGKNWYKGMKKWGNCFENLGCIQMYKNMRVNDWICSHFFINTKDREDFSFESYVDYKDWYKTIWFLGQLNIFKKSLVVKNKLWWNERLFYGQKEDYYFSKKLNDNGLIHRFNNGSSVVTLTNKYVNPSYIKYNGLSLNPQMELSSINAFFKMITFFLLKSLNLMGFKISFIALENIRGRIYTLILMLDPEKFSHNKEWRQTIK